MNLLNYPLLVTIFTVYAITIIFVIEYTLTHIYFNKDKHVEEVDTFDDIPIYHG
jgi:hypothetical protein